MLWREKVNCYSILINNKLLTSSFTEIEGGDDDIYNDPDEIKKLDLYEDITSKKKNYDHSIADILISNFPRPNKRPSKAKPKLLQQSRWFSYSESKCESASIVEHYLIKNSKLTQWHYSHLQILIRI